MMKTTREKANRSSSKRIINQHRFADRFPALSAIVLIFASTTAVQGIAMLINGALALGVKAFTSEYDFIGYIAGALIVL